MNVEQNEYFFRQKNRFLTNGTYVTNDIFACDDNYFYLLWVWTEMSNLSTVFLDSTSILKQYNRSKAALFINMPFLGSKQKNFICHFLFYDTKWMSKQYIKTWKMVSEVKAQKMRNDKISTFSFGNKDKLQMRHLLRK